ncbi:MAG: outer membrane protein assembly factor BamD [Acidobacteria bacterium]|nr:outer membrane protein assembly factor BamD [Acidobacteriota bacterium]MBV9147415.1 outer membrane protein assembly factor BamD [Acidobacteriota bacterium]MBV9437767.1 outer membrane protein assembly factor BamD [Acidobacteriota bacterium]
MIHRYSKLVFALIFTMMVAGCHHNKVTNPIANLDSKQPDKVLFDRAMDAMKHGKYDVARITLQTLINTYPDSEFIARAKLAVGDSWYAEGTTAAYQQAEVEYKDFQTFFPQLPEAAEAQLRIADMHYKQMEKADRDYTHAMRAEDEYRQLIQLYPDNTKLVPIAKQRLREVQEVLAERQYRIGRFYYLRESYPAAIARLKTLTDTYPLYSQADDALLMLGKSYENEALMIKNSKMLEAPKMRLVKDYNAQAAQVYDKIVERYPLSSKADDARSRLKDLGQSVPTPSKEAIAENKAEEDSRGELGHFSSFMSTFRKAPDDLVRAPKVGEPTLIDPQQTSAPQIIRAAGTTALGLPNSTGNSAATVEKVTGDVPKSEPVPRSDAPSASDNSSASGSGTGAAASPGGNTAPPASGSSASTSEQGIGDLTPNAGTPATQPAAAQPGTAAASGDANSASSNTPPAAPPQVNEIQNGNSTQSSTASATNAASTSNSDDQGSSSSKKKKKKGLKRIVPF